MKDGFSLTERDMLGFQRVCETVLVWVCGLQKDIFNIWMCNEDSFYNCKYFTIILNIFKYLFLKYYLNNFFTHYILDILKYYLNIFIKILYLRYFKILFKYFY